MAKNLRSKAWCSCEDTMDEFGGCVPDSKEKKCVACGKRISAKTLSQYRQRRLRESGWEEEFNDKVKVYPLNVDIVKNDLELLLIRYFNLDTSKIGSEFRVKVRAKKGLIQIEKIK